MKYKISIVLALLLIGILVGCNENRTTAKGKIYTDVSDITSSFTATASNIEPTTDNTSNANITTKQSTDNIVDDNYNALSESSTSNSSKTSGNNNANNKIKASSVYSGGKNKENDYVESKTSSQAESSLSFNNILVKSENEDSFKTVGRCKFSKKNGIALNWGGSSVEFNVLCEGSLSLTFSPETEGCSIWLKIVVDGVCYGDERYEINKSTDINIADDLKYGAHHVKIVRLTGAEAPAVIFTTIKAYGELVEKAPENKTFYIEAVGDSAFLGRGVLLQDSFFEQGFSQETARASKNCDATKTYPYLAAEKLNADCYLLANEGMGFAATNRIITQSINDNMMNICDPMGVLPEVYPLISLYSDESYIPERIPDIMVLDIGLSDVQPALLKKVLYNGRVGISSVDAQRIAINFLSNIKQANPELKIIWCYGLMGSSSAHKKYIQNIADDLGGEKNGIYVLELPYSQRSGFPSYSEHLTAADLLFQKIKAVV